MLKTLQVRREVPGIMRTICAQVTSNNRDGEIGEGPADTCDPGRGDWRDGMMQVMILGV